MKQPIEKWYERMRSFCQSCHGYDVVTHIQEKKEWCSNLGNWHFWSIKNCQNCGEISRHISPVAIFEGPVQILCEMPNKNHLKNIRRSQTKFEVRPHIN